jgi:peptidoglycan/xylan/chitin deacetylase (PgdA/CDA1 family)
VTDVMILCYHAVSPTWNGALSVTPEDLNYQLSLLSHRGWHATTFSEALFRPPAQRTLAITFDDAFLSVLRLARPVLASLSWPATVFVPTAFAAARQTLAWQGIEHWQQSDHAAELVSMDWTDLRGLANEGWEIGSHTVSHPWLTTLDDADLRAELSLSMEACSDALGRPCRSIAYPYGDHNERVARIAGDVGYRAGAALSASLHGIEPLRWPRVGIYHGDSGPRFHTKVNFLTRRLRSTRLWRG